MNSLRDRLHAINQSTICLERMGLLHFRIFTQLAYSPNLGPSFGISSTIENYTLVTRLFWIYPQKIQNFSILSSSQPIHRSNSTSSPLLLKKLV